ncbi:MAG: DUF2723 domain-containing protein [Candidatus Abyssobacteria bacterium SURF_17]|uniref:DUF2723 domain-containing protein n=1 Tax=Candidatus Abyssobacteria bacterium SURF_17 TaxID=2093361 RepID=A0A419EQJ0_9BACT|nr:MAG: DUF2723 domain-containing protein [Candidatus Abyssubacteria bacterium SURF_17]
MSEPIASPTERTVSPVRLRAREVVPAVCVFAVSLAGYLYTLAPTVTFGDSGELITAAVTLGVAHPPGYPLWLLIAKVFSLLPVGDVAYRINLMSAVLDAAAIGVLTLVIAKTLPRVCGQLGRKGESESRTEGIIIACLSASASLYLAFSPTFWQQSVVAEVYALNNLILCVILLLLALWGEAPENRGFLFALSFLFGAGQANHQTLLLLGPALAFYVLLVRPRTLLDVRLVAGCVVLFFVGLCFYVYLPISASTNPPLNWGNPATWESFWFHVSRKQYRTIEVVRPFSVFWPQVKFFFSSVLEEFSPLPMVIMVPTVFLFTFIRYKQGRIWLLFTLAAFLCTGILLMVLANTELDLNAQDILQIYFLPACVIVALFNAYFWGMMLFPGLSRTRKGMEKFAVLASMALVMQPIAPYKVNYDEVNMRGHAFGRLYGELLMDTLPESALLVAGTDSAYAIPMYMKWVEGMRPDASILSVNRLADPNYAIEAQRNVPGVEYLTPNDYAEAFALPGVARPNESGVYGASRVAQINGYLLLKLVQRNISERPIYYDEGIPIEWVRDYAMPSGLLLNLSENRIALLPPDVLAADADYWDSLEERLLSDDTFQEDIPARQKFSKCRSNIGALYLHRKMYAEAEAALTQAIRFSNRNIEAYALLAIMYKEMGNSEIAVRTFEGYMKRDPWNTSARSFYESLRE